MADNKTAEANAAGVKAYCDLKYPAPSKGDADGNKIALFTLAGCVTGLLVGKTPLALLGGCALGASIPLYRMYQNSELKAAHDRCVADTTHMVIEVPKIPAPAASAASAPTLRR